jgi:hypothetical protein
MYIEFIVEDAQWNNLFLSWHIFLIYSLPVTKPAMLKNEFFPTASSTKDIIIFVY